MAQTFIPKSSFEFLQKLEKNNNRDWFEKHKPAFKVEEQLVKDFFQELKEEMDKHDHIEKLKVFRIYRDVRFSKDKTPYKKSFSGGFTRATAALRGGYYLHLQPTASFAGGGFWQPNKEDLLRIRQEIAADDTELRAIIADKTFKKMFGDLRGEELKTAPKGFDKEHPAIDLLRKKSFTVHRAFSDKEVQSKNFLKKVNETFMAMRPYFDYMSDVLTTDLNGRSLI